MDNAQLRKLMEEQLRLSRRLKARIQELEAAAHAPLAVVGMALRLPGGLSTPEQYWQFLVGDGDALSEIPDDRPGLRAVYDPRPDLPGHSYVRRAGFLSDIASFDAGFFGISHREAESMDPQQRMLLETAWEALERAGVAARRQDRLDAGVFIGIMSSEYGQRLAGRGDKSGIDPYYGTGGGHCFAAGRISYHFGFRGPAVSVDTACSSSLVALHLAAQSLRRNECRYALVGGANLILSADLMVSLCRSGALSPDGRSKPFTAAADGYGRGEGVGVLVLMRLADAEREGRPILAVVRGTAVNHDGASSGLTVPSGPAQQEVITAALADAGVDPTEVGYVEAHGTGTALGDPIEAGALDAVMGSGAATRDTPLYIGSVKARIGHLEAAAGIAGLLKLVLMLGRGEIPASLDDADELNPFIPWQDMRLAVPRRVQAWPASYPRRLAGISAFGLSGTNAHAVLEAYQPALADGPAVPTGRLELLTVSAKDAEGLRVAVDAVRRTLRAASPTRLPSLCHTLRAGRVAFRYRVAVTGSTPDELASALAAAVEGAVTGPSEHPPRAVELRVRPRELTDAAVDALIDAYPLLAGHDPGLTAGPQARLAALLGALGLRVRSVADPAPVGTAARLAWSDRAVPLAAGDPAATPGLLLRALAELFRAGAEVRLDVLAAPNARFVPDAPTYPLRRRRYWIDEPTVEQLARVDANLAGQPQGAGDAVGVREFLLAELASVLKTDDEIDCSQTFLDVGGDSFTAMLFAKAIEQRYGLELSSEDFVADVPLATMLDQIRDDILAAGQPGAAA